MNSNIEQMIMGMAKAIENQPGANNFKFRNEEEALRHASRVAKLKVGDYVTFRDSEGMHNGVVVAFDKHSRPMLSVYDPKDFGLDLRHVPPAAIIFDDMPEERIDEPDIDDEDIADDFPRT